MVDFITSNWVAITGTVGMAIAWLVDSKNRKSDSLTRQGGAMESMQAAYDRFVEDAQNQYNSMGEKLAFLEGREREAIAQRAKLSERIRTMEREMIRDKSEIRNLQTKIQEYELKIKAYEDEVANYRGQVTRLTAELAKYKKN